MFPDVTAEEYSAALDEVAGELLDQGGCAAPPVNALLLARTLGVEVAWDRNLSGRARYVRLAQPHQGRRGAILLRPEPRKERRQWAVAHEIGEQAAHRVCERLGVDLTLAAPNAREQVANHLAGRLLLPRGWFYAAALECGWDLGDLKPTFVTASHELIARRMLDFSPQVVISVWDQGQLSWRRSNLPGRLPPLWPAERACTERVHLTGHSLRQESFPLSIAAWPVHEPHWKREIVRTEVQWELAATAEDF